MELTGPSSQRSPEVCGEGSTDAAPMGWSLGVWEIRCVTRQDYSQEEEAGMGEGAVKLTQHMKAHPSC